MRSRPSNSAMREAWRFWQPSIGTFPPPSIHRVRSRSVVGNGNASKEQVRSWCDRFSAWTPPDSLWTHPTRWRSPSAISTAQQRGSATSKLVFLCCGASGEDRPMIGRLTGTLVTKSPTEVLLGRPWGRLRPRNSSFRLLTFLEARCNRHPVYPPPRPGRCPATLWVRNGRGA